jgi:hypothetical protein
VVTKQYLDSILGSIGESGGYVAKSGDTMTGPLTISEPGPSSDLILSASSGLGTANNIFGQTLGVTRWILAIGNYVDETGGNAGSDFEISRHDDAGGYLDSPFSIQRSTGYTTISCLTVGPESSNGFLTLNKSTGSSTIRGANLGSARWDIYLGDNTPETTRANNAGSDFGITRFADNGSPIEKALQISRASGDITINHDPTLPLGVATKQYVDTVAGGAISEAPTDGQTYGRLGQNASWNPVLPLTGGTVRGKITVYLIWIQAQVLLGLIEIFLGHGGCYTQIKGKLPFGMARQQRIISL